MLLAYFIKLNLINQVGTLAHPGGAVAVQRHASRPELKKASEEKPVAGSTTEVLTDYLKQKLKGTGEAALSDNRGHRRETRRISRPAAMKDLSNPDAFCPSAMLPTES